MIHDHVFLSRVPITCHDHDNENLAKFIYDQKILIMSTINTLKSIILLIFMLLTSVTIQAQTASAIANDLDAVHAAVEDYVLGLYEVAPERIARSVDTSLYKIGYYDYNGESYYNARMTYQQLYDLSAKWNKSGEQINTDTRKKIEIYEVHDKTAAAKLTAKWGIDFMHLAKNSDGQWKIMSIMWQSEPK